MAKKKTGKVTNFADFKKGVQPSHPPVPIEDILGMMKPLNPLGVSSDQDILNQMKNSGDPTLAAFAADLEREQRGEKVDMRKYSDL